MHKQSYKEIIIKIKIITFTCCILSIITILIKILLMVQIKFLMYISGKYNWNLFVLYVMHIIINHIVFTVCIVCDISCIYTNSSPAYVFVLNFKLNTKYVNNKILINIVIIDKMQHVQSDNFYFNYFFFAALFMHEKLLFVYNPSVNQCVHVCSSIRS